MNTFKVTREDIVQVAQSVNIELTEQEIEWVLLCYEDAQRQDPSGTWNLVVEDLAYQAVNFRKNTDPIDDLPPISNYHSDGDGDDTLLNFMG